MTNLTDDEMDECTDFASPVVPNTFLEGEEIIQPNTEEWPPADQEGEGAQASTGIAHAYEASHPFSNGVDHLADSAQVTVPEETQRNSGESNNDFDGLLDKDVMELHVSEPANTVLVESDFGGFESAELGTTKNQNLPQEDDHDVFGVFDATPSVEQSQPSSLLEDGHFDGLVDPVPTPEDDNGECGDVEASYGIHKAEEIGIEPTEPALVENDEFGDFDGAGKDIVEDIGGEPATVHNDDFGEFEGSYCAADLFTTSPTQENNIDFDDVDEGVTNDKPVETSLIDFENLDRGMDQSLMQEGDNHLIDLDVDLAEASDDKLTGQTLVHEDDILSNSGSSENAPNLFTLHQGPTQEGNDEFGGFDKATEDVQEESVDEQAKPALVDDLMNRNPTQEDNDEFRDFDGVRVELAENPGGEPAIAENYSTDQNPTEGDNHEFIGFDEAREDKAKESTGDFDEAGDSSNAPHLVMPNQVSKREEDVEFGDFDEKSGNIAEMSRDQPAEPILVDDLVEQTPMHEDEFGNFEENAINVSEESTIEQAQAATGGLANTADLSPTVQNPKQECDDEIGDFDGVCKDNAELSEGEPALVDDAVDHTPTQEDGSEFGDFNKASQDAPEESGEEEQAEPAGLDNTADPSTTIRNPTQEDDSEFGDFDGAPGDTPEMVDGEQALIVDDDDDDFGEFGGFENADLATATTNQSPKQADDDDFGDFGDFGEANNGAESEAVDRTHANGTDMNPQKKGELTEIVEFSERASLKFQGMFVQYSREPELPLEEIEEKSVDIVPISSILKQELENRSEAHTPINLLNLLRGPREAHTATPFAYINSKALSHSPHLSYQSWISKFESSSAPFSPENVFLPFDQSTEKTEKGEAEMASKPTIAEGEPKNRSASAPTETVVQLPAAEPKETIVELPPLPTKSSTSQSEQVAAFLKQIPDLSYMLSSKLSQPSS